MGTRGRCDHDRVQIDLLQHGVKIVVGGHAGVLLEHPEYVAGGVADPDHLHVWVGVDHRVVRETHLAEPDDSNLDHDVSSSAAGSEERASASGRKRSSSCSY